MSSGHQRIKWRRKTAENFNWLSRVHERYRQTTNDRRQTDGRTTTYSEREHEFTFAKNVCSSFWEQMECSLHDLLQNIKCVSCKWFNGRKQHITSIFHSHNTFLYKTRHILAFSFTQLRQGWAENNIWNKCNVRKHYTHMNGRRESAIHKAYKSAWHCPLCNLASGICITN